MNNLALKFSVPGGVEQAESFIAVLTSIGYEGFQEEESSLIAYISEALFEQQDLKEVLKLEAFEGISLIAKEIQQEQNWNAIWESAYEAVTIAGRCHVRAPFHPSNKDVEFELVIEPKMSFGTAHHETTSMMVSLLLETNVAGKSMLDMGSGTGILAILARKLGAQPVVAVDNDVWAVNNANDNILLNNTPDVEIVMGDASWLVKTGRTFELVFANINRNILLNDMQFYEAALLPHGMLIMSGFYADDLELLRQNATKLGLQFVRMIENNHWAAAVFQK
ncbi:MAG: 50S ribosomal protein L11 methyltransferase [Bacteroidales bacterium]|nr:50S ribosomal protein L11 methyltransferase [Bacteroidales bacterium]